MSTESEYTESDDADTDESLEGRIDTLEAELARERAERRRLEEQIQQNRRRTLALITHTRQLYTHLDTRLGSLDERFATYWNHFLDRLFPELDIQDYTSNPMPRFAPVEKFAQDLHQTVDTVEENPTNPSGDPMTENWQAVVDHARTLANDPNHQRPDGHVTLYVQDVANATGKSKRWCRQLVEGLAADHVGARLQEAKENPKQGSENRKKALLVHMDVWGEDE